MCTEKVSREGGEKACLFEKVQVAEDLSGLLEDLLGRDFSFGYTGSVSRQTARPDSDLDVDLILPSLVSLKELPSDERFRRIFPRSAESNKIPPFRELTEFDVVGMPGRYLTTDIGMYISSFETIKRLCSLEEFVVKRFRLHSVRDRIDFRSFTHSRDADGSKTVSFQNSRLFDIGWESSIPSLVVDKGRCFFGLHIDRLLSLRLLFDGLDIRSLLRELQENLRLELYKEQDDQGDSKLTIFSIFENYPQLAPWVINGLLF